MLGGRADAQEKRYLDEDDYECRDPVLLHVRSPARGVVREGRVRAAYRHMMLKMMTRLRLNRLAMPSAKHSSTQMMPVLGDGQSVDPCVFDCELVPLSVDTCVAAISTTSTSLLCATAY